MIMECNDFDKTYNKAQSLSDDLLILAHKSAKLSIENKRLKKLVHELAAAMYKDDTGELLLNFDMISTEQIEYMREIVNENN